MNYSILNSGLNINKFCHLQVIEEEEPFFEFPDPPSQEELDALEQHHDQTSREQQGNNTWQESSVENSDPRQISDVEAEFTIVRGGSKREGDMLFDKDGYSYNIKRTLAGFENRKFNIVLLLQL